VLGLALATSEGLVVGRTEVDGLTVASRLRRKLTSKPIVRQERELWKMMSAVRQESSRQNSYVYTYQLRPFLLLSSGWLAI
jgi:hypothetical protein